MNLEEYIFKNNKTQSMKFLIDTNRISIRPDEIYINLLKCNSIVAAAIVHKNNEIFEYIYKKETERVEKYIQPLLNQEYLQIPHFIYINDILNAYHCNLVELLGNNNIYKNIGNLRIV